MGFEGANVLFDTWVHPLMMGLEEHLLTMFREDFEFHDSAAPSHLGAVGPESAQNATAAEIAWAPEAEAELSKVPFFVRGKARSNTQSFALARGITRVTVETLYDAKAHFSR